MRACNIKKGPFILLFLRVQINQSLLHAKLIIALLRGVEAEINTMGILHEGPFNIVPNRDTF